VIPLGDGGKGNPVHNFTHFSKASKVIFFRQGLECVSVGSMILSHGNDLLAGQFRVGGIDPEVGRFFGTEQGMAHTEGVGAGGIVDHMHAWGDGSVGQGMQDARRGPSDALGLKDGIAVFLGGSMPGPAGGWVIGLLDIAPKACKIFGREVSHEPGSGGGIRTGEMGKAAFGKARRKGAECLARVGFAVPKDIRNPAGRVKMVVEIERWLARGPGACRPQPASIVTRKFVDFGPKAPSSLCRELHVGPFACNRRMV